MYQKKTAEVNKSPKTFFSKRFTCFLQRMAPTSAKHVYWTGYVEIATRWTGISSVVPDADGFMAKEPFRFKPSTDFVSKLEKTVVLLQDPWYSMERQALESQEVLLLVQKSHCALPLKQDF